MICWLHIPTRRVLSLLLILALLHPLLLGCADPSVERAAAETAPVECLDKDVAPAACAYLSAALDTMQAHALVRDAVDWDVVRSAAFDRAQRALNAAETYPAIEEAIDSLGDNHSFFLPPEEGPGVEGAMANRVPFGRVLDDEARGNLAQIVLVPFVPMDEASAQKYADTTQDIIWQLRHHDPCGWIVDLRWNTGGNMWPMLAGIGPLLGEGTAGAMRVDADELWWRYRGGKALLGDSVLSAVPDPIEPAVPSVTPVAVLTDRRTGSSGEAVAIAFRGRANTRSFGQPTAGVPTANSPYELSDGARLVLTTARMADRTGRLYYGRIEPDSVVDANAALDVAATWLASTPSCR